MNEFEEKTREVHGGFYLTLVSIMQSLALGYLLQTVGNELLTNGFLHWNMVLQSVVVLFFIILVWHEYAIGTIAYRWRLDMFDSAIPFLIGIAEYFSIAAIAVPETNKAFGTIRYTLWLWSLAGFAFTGTLAYINQAMKAEVEAGMKPLLVAPKKNLRHAIGNMLVFLIIALSASIYPLPDTFHWIVTAFICGMFLNEAIRINKVYVTASLQKLKKVRQHEKH
jgi:hypothetical protein